MSTKAKELEPLVKAVRARGFRVVPSGGGHYKILGKDNKAVRDDDGPLIISGSPSERRARDMHVHRLMKAKVLLIDPWAPDKGNAANGNGDGKKRSRIADPDVQAAKIAAIKEKSRKQAALTLELRGRLEPLVVKLGGWNSSGSRGGSGVTASELGLVARHWANVHSRVGVWANDAAARGAAQTLKTGGTLGEKPRELFTLIVDELETVAKKGGAEGVRQRYFALIRDAKGLAPERGPELPAPGPVSDASGNGSGVLPPAAAPPPIVTRVVDRPSVLPGDTGEVPTLALRSLAEMMMGDADEERRDRAIKLAEDILRLELGGSS